MADQIVKFTTHDGSVWLMDQDWVQQQQHSFDKSRHDDFEEYLNDEVTEIYEDWLYPHGRLVSLSAQATALFDGVLPNILDESEDEPDEYDDLYENGWNIGEFTVEPGEQGLIME